MRKRSKKMAGAIVKNNHLHFNGKNYFRVGSEDVQLGSYGEKKSPITQGNYLEVQSKILGERLKVREAIEVDIDTTKTSERELLANINVAAVFKGSAKTAYEDLKSQKLRLVKLEVDNEDMKFSANQSPNAIENLIEYGNEAHIAHQVFIVLDAEMAHSFTSSTSFDVSANAGVVKVTGQGRVGSSGQTTITLSEGSTFAYGMLKLDWDANMKRNKTKIVKATDDQWGPN
jgi:hypothetical protein